MKRTLDIQDNIKKKQKADSRLTSLPIELICSILSLIRTKDLGSVFSLCKFMRDNFFYNKENYTYILKNVMKKEYHDYMLLTLYTRRIYSANLGGDFLDFVKKVTNVDSMRSGECIVPIRVNECFVKLKVANMKSKIVQNYIKSLVSDVINRDKNINFLLVLLCSNEKMESSYTDIKRMYSGLHVCNVNNVTEKIFEMIFSDAKKLSVRKIK